jgi:archaellum component FlaC
MNEEQEQALDALMRERRKVESRLNRALGELLGSGRGAPESLAAIEEMETVLRSIASLASQLET